MENSTHFFFWYKYKTFVRLWILFFGYKRKQPLVFVIVGTVWHTLKGTSTDHVLNKKKKKTSILFEIFIFVPEYCQLSLSKTIG